MNEQKELIPMATGEYLKQKRLKRKLSLQVVAEAICLDEKVLGEIEQDEANHIALVYKNGYIRTYAQYLQIPEDEIQIMLTPPETNQAAIRNIFPESPKRNPMERWLRATSYVLASLLIGTLAWQFTHEAVRLSQDGSRITGGEKNVPELKNTDVAGQTQQLRGTVKASIAPLGVLHNSEESGLDTAEQAWAAITRPALPEGESLLNLSVSADSWVEIIDANGQELEMDLLRGGSEKDYHGKPPFRILFGRASAVRLMVDGEAVDLVQFTRDDVAQLSWPKKLQAANKVDGLADEGESGNN
jgi:cytoskeleton protein RodZ